MMGKPSGGGGSVGGQKKQASIIRKMGPGMKACGGMMSKGCLGGFECGGDRRVERARPGAGAAAIGASGMII
jgi:hypothetical protein